MTYDHLDDAALLKLTRRRLQERPTDEQAWQESVAELRARAPVRAVSPISGRDM
jgi:hypothetical protein